jgi:hypothetical protein
MTEALKKESCLPGPRSIEDVPDELRDKSVGREEELYRG